MLTKEGIKELLQTNNRAVERAILVLFDRQTCDEQSLSTTRHENQRGFSCAHASKGSYYARWIKSGRKLTGWHLENARRITQRYSGQLLLAAHAKASKGNVGEPVKDEKPAAQCPDEPTPGCNEDMEDLEVRMHMIEQQADRLQSVWEEAHKRAARRMMKSQSPNYVGGYHRVQDRG